LTGRVDFFSLTYGAYQGGLLNAEAALSWHFTPNWSASLGYRFVRYDLDVSKDDLVGAMKYRFNGPSLGVAFAF
jgi:outer membrane receptor protein involved in Fe transport